MTNEQYLTLKEEYINHIKTFVTESGGLLPHITVFADIKKPKDADEEKPAIIHIPIPSEYMDDDTSKDKFVKNVIPDLFKAINEKFIPNSVAWASEAWLREANKNFDVKGNWKELPIKKEVIILTIESESKTEAIIFNVKREGKQVMSDGKIIDIINLTEDKELSDSNGNFEGRFSGLFKKLKG